MVAALGVLAVSLVVVATVLGDHHPIAGGTLMALALLPRSPQLCSTGMVTKSAESDPVRRGSAGRR